MTPSLSLRWSVYVLAACALVGAIYLGRPVLLPIVLAVFLFYALDPIVDRLDRWHLPRVLGSVGVVGVMVCASVAGATLLWPQVQAVVERMPEGARQLRATMRETGRAAGGPGEALRKVREAAKALDQAAVESTEPSVTSRGTLRVEVVEQWRPSDLLWTSGVGMLGFLGQAFSVLFLTVFLLIEDDAFKRKLVRRMETVGRKRITVEVLNDIATQIERFIWVQILTSSGVALVTGLALWWMEVEQPAAWGLFAGVMNLVPYFGPLIVTGALSAVAFLQFGAVSNALAVGAVVLLITTIEGNFLTPKLLSRAASLNLVAIFVSVTFWSWVWGAMGMLLAVPILMVIKVVSDRIDGLTTLSLFLGE